RGHTGWRLSASYFTPPGRTMPDVGVETVEGGGGKGPLTARATGGPPVGPAAPAIASAIADATGCRPARLPMTAERILALLDAAASRRGKERPGGERET